MQQVDKCLRPIWLQWSICSVVLWNFIKKISSRQTISTLVLLFFVSSPLCAHKYYVSTVNMKKEGDTLRVEMSVFYDDMELAIYEQSQRYVRLCPVSKNKKHEADSLVFSYIVDRFYLVVGDVSLLPSYDGYTCTEETIQINLLFLLPSMLPECEIKITDSVLMDVFPEQRNIIQYCSSERRETHLLSLGRDTAGLNIQ